MNTKEIAEYILKNNSDFHLIEHPRRVSKAYLAQFDQLLKCQEMVKRKNKYIKVIHEKNNKKYPYVK